MDSGIWFTHIVRRSALCPDVDLIVQSLGTGKDTAHEGMLLFIQHGLILSNYSDAIKYGDPERVLSSLRHFTVWFQGSRHTNYGREMIHLAACIKYMWSPELVASYKRNMVISISGKQGDWLPCDLVNEDIVKENKAMIGDRVTPETDNHVRNVNALLIYTFRNVKAKIAQECDAYVSDYHSSAVDSSKDVATVANIVLRNQVCTRDVNRESSEKDRDTVDLYAMGQKALGETSRLSEYKKMTIQKGSGMWDGLNEEGWTNTNSTVTDGDWLDISEGEEDAELIDSWNDGDEEDQMSQI